jgi:hypothetical protein
MTAAAFSGARPAPLGQSGYRCLYVWDDSESFRKADESTRSVSIALSPTTTKYWQWPGLLDKDGGTFWRLSLYRDSGEVVLHQLKSAHHYLIGHSDEQEAIDILSQSTNLREFLGTTAPRWQYIK